MSGLENIRVVERLDEAFKSTDFSRVREALALIDNPEEALKLLGHLAEIQLEKLDPEVVIDISAHPVGFPGGNRWQGFDGWIDFWREWLEPWDDFDYDSSNMEAVGPHVVLDVVITARGRESGAPVEWRQTQLWTFRHGWVIGLRPYQSREEALAAAEELSPGEED